jgi:Flp pilus assembly protein TadD
MSMTPLSRLIRDAAIACAILAIAGCGHFRMKRAGESAKLSPSQTAEIQVALGRSLESEGDVEKAMEAYRLAIRIDPKRADAHVRLAVALDRLGRFSEAAPHYDAALKARPGDAEIFCDRGYSLALQGRDQEAEAALRQAIAKDPRLARAHNNLGLLLGRAGKSDEAMAEFRKAGCSEADAHLNLAVALGESRRWDDARRHVASARSLGGNTVEANSGAAQIEALIAGAETRSSRAATLDKEVQTAGAASTDVKPSGE